MRKDLHRHLLTKGFFLHRSGQNQLHQLLQSGKVWACTVYIQKTNIKPKKN